MQGKEQEERGIVCMNGQGSGEDWGEGEVGSNAYGAISKRTQVYNMPGDQLHGSFQSFQQLV